MGHGRENQNQGFPSTIASFSFSCSQFDFQNKVINFTRWLQQYLLFAYQYILFIRSTINLSCNHPCFRRSILLCATLLKAVNKKKLPRVREEVRSHGDASGSVSFKVSRWLSHPFFLCHLLPSTMVTDFSFYEKRSNMVTRDRGRKDEVDILSRLLCILQSFKAIL